MQGNQMEINILLIVIIIVALGFDYVNGFHDSANAIATVVSTRALSPRQAVILAATLNIAGAFLMGFHMGVAQFLSFAAVLILGVVCFSAFGIASAAFIIYFKRRDPFSMAFSIASGFLGGVYFPVDKLPFIWQKVAQFIPLTYLLRDLRLILLEGYTLSFLKQDLLIIMLFCILFLPLSLMIFNLTMKRVMQDGSLSHY